MSAPRLAVCLVVTDDGPDLHGCLQSLRQLGPLLHETCVYGAGASEATLEAARRAGARAESGEWDGDGAAVRNRAACMTQASWVLFLEPDERLRVDPEKLAALLHTSAGDVRPTDCLAVEVSRGRADGGPRRAPRLRSLLLLASASTSPTASTTSTTTRSSAPVFVPPATTPLRRVLYCANAGDARGVLCRGGRGVRLTYDRKGTDKQEAKRIMDAGGFVMSGRVNGVLAVTRSLGDSSMKEYVVGAPYTTETDLTDDDEFMILACDGVSTVPYRH